MKRRIVFSLAGFLLIFGLITLIYQHLQSSGRAGYVMIGLGDWVLETSFYVMAIFLVAMFIGLNLAIFFTIRAIRLPEGIKQKNLSQRQKRSEAALTQGFIEAIEGKWDKAERTLIRHAGDSVLPLMHFLIAARAAHFREAPEQREEYLERALRLAPDHKFSIALLRASLLIETREDEAALELLDEIHRHHANHPSVLRMMREAYERLFDEEALHHLIPKLREAKLYPEMELRALEVRIYESLLMKRAQTRDPSMLREIWRWVPAYLQIDDRLVRLYSESMIEAGVGAEVEEILRLALGREWSPSLLALYGRITLEDPKRQFTAVQEWLGPHREDSDLHCLLARLALCAGDEARAIALARASLRLSPRAEAFKILGDTFFARREEVLACRLYRQGLRLDFGEPLELEGLDSVLDLLEVSISGSEPLDLGPSA